MEENFVQDDWQMGRRRRMKDWRYCVGRNLMLTGPLLWKVMSYRDPTTTWHSNFSLLCLMI